MANREFLQLAHTFEPDKHDVRGWFVSEKLDGMRAFWDGGISIGKPASEIPWANTEKDSRLIKPPISTGLWSRYGKVIHAPDWWIGKLPGFPLDGELYISPGRFQATMSIVKEHHPRDSDWKLIKFKVFTSPAYFAVFQNGVINNPQFKKTFSGITYPAFSLNNWRFSYVYEWLRESFSPNEVFQVHEQVRLPTEKDVCLKHLYSMLDRVTDDGGEGLMLQKPEAFWAPKRNPNLLKVKKLLDDEAQVIGYTWGRETDKGSKLLGMMGALIVQYGSHVFELSGFTDNERFLCTSAGDFEQAKGIGVHNPGQRVDDDIYNPAFPRGSSVTFRYRELTDAGIPKEARFWRK